MGKGTDKLYITHSEWSSSDAYSASVGSNAGSRAARRGASFKKLPFNFCAASLQPFKNPVCTPEGTIFDVEVISTWLDKHATNPVNGEPLAAKDLIKLNFARNADIDDADRNRVTDGKGDLIDPVTFKIFTDNTHIVAIRHGNYANVFAWETVERMNIKAKMWRDLVDDVEFGRKDIITLQDPQNAASRDLSQFKYLQDGEEAILTKEQEAERNAGNVNIEALGRVGEKVLRAKEAVERARQQRQLTGDVNRTLSKQQSSSSLSKPTPRAPGIQEKKIAHNAAVYTTGAAAASFTSTGLTPSTSGERAILTDEEWMLKPKRVKNKGYARIETNLGDLNIELSPEFAPKAVWNFVRLAQRGYYKGVAFHRSIKNFMIQGGDPTGTGRGGSSIWGRNFEDEFEGPLVHDARGVISMANKGKNTNSSQFFILYRAAKHLDKKHSIFAKIIGNESFAVLDKMENMPVEEGGSNRPVEDIVIKDVVVFVDPFEEFLKDKGNKEKEKKEREDITRMGGTEDDRTTWTGKRLRREDGSLIRDGDRGGGGGGGGVGKYLNLNSGKDGNGRIEKDDKALAVNETWEEDPGIEEPVRKKVRTGGFGNFDNW
ncbi:putative cyclophilin type peptidyl-prolyl cis-trans isomerase [Rhypophila decipiens]|uniref:Peptidyl-prolyl cis-trans isomerase-like 2 n=1 Tax=Rhypophila decipiens TaxID=261697 RepID=A0AAN6YCS4_9PEZI|nr:putative cyclophilin type peptidyl-prolyl cis-trans isomerase [Rhypophila decipiens]